MLAFIQRHFVVAAAVAGGRIANTLPPVTAAATVISARPIPAWVGSSFSILPNNPPP